MTQGGQLPLSLYNPRRDDGCRWEPGQERTVGADFAGAWDGTAFYAPEGLSSALPMPARLSLVASADQLRLHVSGLCPDGSASLELKDTGAGPEWDGIYICPPVDVASCTHAGLILFSLALRLEGDILRGDGRGTWWGCDVTGPMTFAFTGARL